MSGRAERWDRLGIWASIACGLHCLATPLIALLGPTLAAGWSHPAWHSVVAMLVVPAAASIVFGGYRKHRQHWVLALAVCGVLFIVAGCVLPFVNWGGEVTGCSDCCASVTFDEETGWLDVELPAASLVTVAGSVLLVTSHFGNWSCSAGCATCPAP